MGASRGDERICAQGITSQECTPHSLSLVHTARGPTPSPRLGGGTARSVSMSLDAEELPGPQGPRRRMGPLPNKAAWVQQTLPLQGLH